MKTKLVFRKSIYEQTNGSSSALQEWLNDCDGSICNDGVMLGKSGIEYVYCDFWCEEVPYISSPNEYQQLALRTANPDKKHEWLDNAIFGLFGEGGEVSDIVKKHKFQGHDLDREEIIKEAGDICWYLALLCSAVDVDLQTVMTMNIEKLVKRYPEGFDSARSINRTE